MRSEDYERIRAALDGESTAARQVWDEASEKFDTIIRDVPSGLPHPDGVQRIHNASRELSEARSKFMACTERTSKFLVHGVVPDDLQQLLRQTG